MFQAEVSTDEESRVVSGKTGGLQPDTLTPGEDGPITRQGTGRWEYGGKRIHNKRGKESARFRRPADHRHACFAGVRCRLQQVLLCSLWSQRARVCQISMVRHQTIDISIDTLSAPYLNSIVCFGERTLPLPIWVFLFTSDWNWQSDG